MNEMTIRETGKRANLEEWSQRVAECRSSGLTAAQWCAENGIKEKTYYTWRRRVFAATEERQEGPRFARLSTPERRGDLAATVRIGQVTVDVYTGADADTVAAIVRRLRPC